MTVDASRSCLGLGTCVGSAIRQIVDARVLLTATAPPALSGSRMSYGSLAPPLNRIMLVFRSACHHRDMPGDRPDKARQFTGNRSGDDIGRLASAGEPAIAGAQPQLRLPGDLADRLGLALLPEQQFAADPGREAAGPAPAKAGVQAASISSRRAAPFPALVRPPRLMLVPLECSDGTSPR